VGQVSPTTGRCNKCGRVYPLSEFKVRRKKSQKAPWIEWKCKDCRREYDTKQKRARRATEEGHENYNDYMRDYMRSYYHKKKYSKEQNMNPAQQCAAALRQMADDMEKDDGKLIDFLTFLHLKTEYGPGCAVAPMGFIMPDGHLLRFVKRFFDERADELVQHGNRGKPCMVESFPDEDGYLKYVVSYFEDAGGQGGAAHPAQNPTPSPKDK